VKVLIKKKNLTRICFYVAASRHSKWEYSKVDFHGAE